MEDIDFDLDVEQAFLQGYETPGVDFKAPGPWREKPVEEACSLIKDLIAFANYGGGLIIIGVTELSDRSFQFDGLSDDDCSTWEQTRVSNFLDERVEPRLRFRVTTVMREGKKFKVIKVLPFDDLPHMCVRREAGELRRMTIYVRNDKTESAPVRTPAEMNRIIERAVINRGDRLLQSMHSILRGAAITPEADSAELFATEVAQADEQGAPDLPTSWGTRRGFRKVMWYPARYDMERFGLQELRKALEHASAPLRAWPFLYLRQGATSPRNFEHGVEAENAWQHPHWVNVQHYQYWRAYTSGAFY